MQLKGKLQDNCIWVSIDLVEGKAANGCILRLSRSVSKCVRVEIELLLAQLCFHHPT